MLAAIDAIELHVLIISIWRPCHRPGRNIRIQRNRIFGNLLGIGDHTSLNKAKNSPAPILREVSQTLLGTLLVGSAHILQNVKSWAVAHKTPIRFDGLSPPLAFRWLLLVTIEAR